MGEHPVRDDIDLLSGHWYAGQPFEQWAWMREHAPVYWDAKNEVWGITRYHDVLAIEKDAAAFNSHRSPRPHGQPLPMMISMDDPAHTRRRKLVNKGFTPRRVREHEQTIRQICRSIIDNVAPKGECDFVWDIAAPLPLLLIADLLGFEADRHDDLLRWSDDLIRATTLDPPPEVADAGLRAMLGFRECQLEVIAERRAEPRDDLISTLCHATIDGESLDDESIVSETLLILIGGDETTRHVLSGGLLALLENPDQLAALRADAALLPGAIEEMLRWVSPIKNMVRTTTRNVTLNGVELPEGAQLLAMYPSANRDETVFTDPDTFDIRRDPNPHLAFGFGTHFCLGNQLARIELRVMFEQLLRRLPDIRLAGPGPFPHRKANFVTGLESLPILFG
jgi:cytochrome P450 family 142 subfamily A polypeptide 1